MEKYIEIFNKLWEHSENEVVEFKKAETNFDIDELGKYFSALSNEANLRDHEFAWIVFGVWDKKHQIIGTTFKDGEVALNRLKQDMSQHTTDNLIFRDIVPLDIEGKRVLLFQIPASPRNIVMHWKGVAYGRDGESLKPLNQAKQDTIRERAGLADKTFTQDQLMDQIEHQCLLEFFGEGHRFDDLKRWYTTNEIKTILKANDKQGADNFQERNRYYPIPTGELNNNSAMQQIDLWK